MRIGIYSVLKWEIFSAYFCNRKAKLDPPICELMLMLIPNKGAAGVISKDENGKFLGCQTATFIGNLLC